MKNRRPDFCFLIILIISVSIFPLTHAAQDVTCRSFFNGNNLVIVSGDGNYFATSDSISGTIRLLEKNGNPVWGYQTSENISSLTISDNGGIIAAGSDNGNVFGFDKNGNLLWKFNDMGCFPKVMITGDGQQGYIVNGDSPSTPYPYTIHYFYRNGTVLWETREPGISSASITTNGKYLVVGTKVGRNSEVILYAKNGTDLWRYPAPDGIEFVAISHDGNTIAAAHSYRLIVLDNKGIIFSKVIPKYHPTTVAISPGGSQIVTGSAFGVQSFNRSGNQLWQTYESGINNIVISNDGQTIISGSQKNVSYFNENGTRIWGVPVDTAVASVSISADGDTILAGLNNGTVFLLNRNGNAKHLSLETLPVRSLPTIITTPEKNAGSFVKSVDSTQVSPLMVPIALTALGMCAIVLKYRRRK